MIRGVGEMSKKSGAEADEARLLYVAAMSRAIGWLVMTYQEHSDLREACRSRLVGRGRGAMGFLTARFITCS